MEDVVGNRGKSAVMRSIVTVIVALVVLFVGASMSAPNAVADSNSGPVMTDYDKLRIQAAKQRLAKQRDRRQASSAEATKSPPAPKYLSKDEYKRQMAAYVAARSAVIKANAARYAPCAFGTEICPTGAPDSLPTPPNIAIAGDPKPTAPAIPPEIVAYQAVAELELTPPTPLIGPDPHLNQWDTAVVGYPLWLAIDGDTTPPPVTDTVYDISVALHARLTKVAFTMGDGHRITCTGTQATHPWTPTVATNQKSPWCGYTYQHVPTHSRTYKVTANTYWAVDWQINDTNGTLPFYQSSSIDLPVSELQVLVR